MFKIVTHFVLISLVFVVVATHHVDVIVAFVSNSAKPFNDDDAIAICSLRVCVFEGGGASKILLEGNGIAKRKRPVIFVRIIGHRLPTLLLIII